MVEYEPFWRLQQVFEHSLSKHILPQCLVAYDDSNICLLIPLCRYRFTISYYYTYSHKIIATFSIYEFGIMAYDVAVIRCIVVALERNMSCPWLIEKTQILKKILKHSLSPIKYRTFATERVLWMVMQITAGCYILFISNS